MSKSMNKKCMFLELLLLDST